MTLTDNLFWRFVEWFSRYRPAAQTTHIADLMRESWRVY